MDSPSVVSLFSGCGGLDLGFAEAGFNIKFAADHDPAAVRAYRHNIGHEVQVLDVLDKTFQARLRELSSCNVLLGGFPCQGFSKAGPKLLGDERNMLYNAMVVALKLLKPDVFVAENVDGLAQNFSGTVLNRIVEDCSAAGYRVEWRIVDAAWFGVPQHRRRILIVGVRHDSPMAATGFPWPTATHRAVPRRGERPTHVEYANWADDLAEPRTIRDAFKDLPNEDNFALDPNRRDLAIMARIGQGQKLCNARHNESSVRTWDIPEAFGTTTSREREILEALVRNRRHRIHGTIPNGNPLSLHVLSKASGLDINTAELDSLVARKFLKRVGSKWDVSGAMFASGIYKRPVLDQPSPTVLTVFANPRYFVHPTENRAFTVREVARLQTFPDTFVFEAAGVAATDAYRLIGNAVPPQLSRALAGSVLGLYRRVALNAAA